MNSKVYFMGIDSYWTEIQIHVRDAIVYMDDPASECLHWHYGIQKLLNFGAVTVENFTPFVKADSSGKKAAFILTSPIFGETLRTLMIIVRARSFKECVVFTSLPSKFHVDGTPDDSSFTALENRIRSWMGNMHYSVTVQHVPIFTAHLAHNLFLLPSFTTQFSVYSCGVLEMNRRRTADCSLKSLPANIQDNVKQLAYSLDAILDTFQVKADVFSLGVLSNIVGFELANLPQQNKKPYSRKTSVVIVDRLLDLAGPLSQSYDTMLDQVFKTFPHLSGHVFDVAVPMTDLAACKNDSIFDRPLLAPGCLAHKGSPEELTTYYAIIEKRPREALIEVNRQLVETATSEGIEVDLKLGLTHEALKKRILDFKQNPKLIPKYSGLLQLALAVQKSLEHISKNPIDQLSATEKALIQYLFTSPEEVLCNIMQMISERNEGSLKMEEILTYLAFIYMLSNCKAFENESAMQATLMEAFFQEDLSELLTIFIDGELEDDSILNAVRTFFSVLRRLGSVKKSMKKYNSVFKSTNPAFPASYDSFLKQLLSDLFNPSIPDIPDLEFHSGGLKTYIKTGISLFMNVAKPHPRDNQDILLVVIGGLTPAEIKFIRDFETQHKDRQIYVCCTQVITPSDVLQDLGSIVKQLVLETSNDDDKEEE